MSWVHRQAQVMHQLSPEVRRFVLATLRTLEEENVFDAPGVINGVLHRMQLSDSHVVRSAVSRTECVLKAAFVPVKIQELGA